MGRLHVTGARYALLRALVCSLICYLLFALIYSHYLTQPPTLILSVSVFARSSVRTFPVSHTAEPLYIYIYISTLTLQSAAVTDESIKASSALETGNPHEGMVPPRANGANRRKVSPAPETAGYVLPPAPPTSTVAAACRRRTGSSWRRPGGMQLVMGFIALLVLWAVVYLLYTRLLAAPLPSVLQAPLASPPVSSRPPAP
jgi:hypothetical protein